MKSESYRSTAHRSTRSFLRACSIISRISSMRAGSTNCAVLRDPVDCSASSSTTRGIPSPTKSCANVLSTKMRSLSPPPELRRGILGAGWAKANITYTLFFPHLLRGSRKADDDSLQELRWPYVRRNLAEAQHDLAPG